MSGPELFPIYVVVGFIIQAGFISYDMSKPTHLQWSSNKTCFFGLLATLVANAVVFLTLGK